MGPSNMTQITAQRYFPDDYITSRARFRNYLTEIRSRWPEARADRHVLDHSDDLTIDWIRADATIEPQRSLILTTGLHGIEGYTGSAVLHLLIREFLPSIDHRHCSLLLLHAINPWGMKHGRKTNATNVDLNRNFLLHADDFDPTFNADYQKFDRFLNPDREVGGYVDFTFGFAAGLLASLLRSGASALQRALLLGQYSNPNGLYYGGSQMQEEARVVRDLILDFIPRRGQVVFLDIHTGYGPPGQLSLVNSPLDPREVDTYIEKFGYKRVVQTDSAEFFAIRGDILDYFYTILEDKVDKTDFFATAFEFGTQGDSLSSLIQSLRAIIFENRMHHHGCRSRNLAKEIQRQFQAFYAPSSPRWRKKALADARAALMGILQAYSFLDQQ
jgi:hypothetical protein